jgi:hypothetical protein
MPAAVKQCCFLLENMKHTRDECAFLHVQKKKHKNSALKQMLSALRFSTSIGYTLPFLSLDPDHFLYKLEGSPHT